MIGLEDLPRAHRAGTGVLDIGAAWVVCAVTLQLEDPLHLEGRETTMKKLLEQIRPLLR